MTITEFNQFIEDRYRKKTLYDSEGHLGKGVVEKYMEDEENLRNEFFQGIEYNLKYKDFKDLHRYLVLLIVDPFSDKDKERYQAIVIRSIEVLENSDLKSNIDKLSSFVWRLLDYMLHSWSMSDDKLMIARLESFKTNLKKFEIDFKDEIELLYQKLGHFGLDI